jgi:putative ATP-dependent endonuclease of the OLD family
MLSTPLEPTLPLVLIVDGENDIFFLSAISAMLHRHNKALPDLSQLAAECRLVFMLTGGSSFRACMTRLGCLPLRTFYLVDREEEPETSVRRQAVAAIKARSRSFAVMTGKRALENYVHPLAIQGACGTNYRLMTTPTWPVCWPGR